MGARWTALVEMQASRESARATREAAEDAACRTLDDAGLRDQMDRGKAAEREFNRRFEAKAEIVANRIKCCDRGQRGACLFTPAELTYSAGARCVCGAGLAYPDGVGIHGSWICSAILTGTAEPGSTHDEGKPFAFWKVDSENQRSAGGATTRPEAA